ncbi:50S ribosomal protein L25/general stress protein Ctc [Solibacillus sp. CAU 1738]|uniref:50S ribosomal protein L25/general stress protein Ctc n=1 Tax=Solibacillus sp. CAU 1738 TaxID=3140363 RepID=UPI0032609080
MSTALQAKKRETAHRSTLTQLRKDGQLAAVIYGYQTETTPIFLNYKATAKAVQRNGYSGVFNLEVEGKKINVILADIQRCSLKGELKHVDFLAINMSEELEVEVPIALVGDAIGVREGGILTQSNHTLKIKVKPSDIPDSIEVDVSKVAIGDTLSLGDVRNQLSFEVLNDDDHTLVAITAPTVHVKEINSEEVGK